MGFQLAHLVKQIGGDIDGDPGITITGVAPVETATQGDLTFVASPKFARHLESTRAAAVIVPPGMDTPQGLTVIRAENPYFLFVKAVHVFHPQKPLIDAGIHPTAVIADDAELGENCSVGAHVTIGHRSTIGKGSVILPGVFIGDDVQVGEECLIHANVSLRERVSVGHRVVIHNGAVIGADGFGFVPVEGVYHKIPQIGTVVIEDDVEIGANTTIDRATLGETRIKRGVKLDNLIQVGHNCSIGENTVISAQTGLSGSTHIGKQVRIGGQVGFAGHMTIGDGTAIGAQSGVSKSQAGGQMLFGTPAKPQREEFRIQGALKFLPEWSKELKSLKKRLEAVEYERNRDAEKSADH